MSEYKIKHIKSKYYKCGKNAACTILYKELGNGMYGYKQHTCIHKDMFCRKTGVMVATNKPEVYEVWVTKGANLFTNILLHIGLGNRVSQQFDNILNEVSLNDL